jgi:hypothetical protein
MAVQLLTGVGSVKHEFYHDLESLFYVMCYICCICAGPNNTLREDLDVFETAIGKWFGKEGRTEQQIGAEKYETVTSFDHFAEHILPAFHSYFEPLMPYMSDLRDIAIPPDRASRSILKRYFKTLPFPLHTMEERGDKQLVEYRKVLQRMFDSLSEDGPRPGGSSLANDNPTQCISPQTPAAEPVQSPIKTRIPESIIGDDNLHRAIDPVPLQEDESQDEQQDVDEVQDKDTEESATLVGEASDGLHSSSKRKSAALQEDEPADDEAGYPQSPTSVSRGGRMQDDRLLGNSGLRSPTDRRSSSKTSLEPTTKTPELERSLETSSDGWRSGSKDSKRRRTREQLEG